MNFNTFVYLKRFLSKNLVLLPSFDSIEFFNESLVIKCKEPVKFSNSCYHISISQVNDCENKYIIDII